MRVIVRTIKYICTLAFNYRARNNKSSLEKKRPKLRAVYEYIAGNSLYFYKKSLETVRVKKYNFRSKFSKDLLFLKIDNIGDFLSAFFIVVVFVFLLDLIIGKNNLDIIPYIKFNFSDGKEIIIAYIGSVNTIVGILITIFTVGIQVTSRYPEEVKKYVLGTIIHSIYLPFLLVVSFNFYTLLLYNVNSNVKIATIVATVLTGYSLLLVPTLIQKFIYDPKAESIFTRSYNELIKIINLVSDPSIPERKSWSIIIYSRHRASDLLTIQKKLFDSLVKNGQQEESRLYLTLVSEQVRYYLEKKRLIERGFGWWFSTKMEKMKSSDSTSYILKSEYEKSGRGKLFQTTPNYSWFEDRVVSYFADIKNQLGIIKEDGFTEKYINSLETIIAGRYYKDESNFPQKIAGSYECQEIEAFEKFLTLFNSLYDNLDIASESIKAYFNSSFFILQVIIEGFDYKELEKTIDRLITEDSQMGLSMTDIENIQLPKIFYEKVKESYEMLELEVIGEGKIVTPKEWLKNMVVTELGEKEKEIFDKYFDLIISQQDKIAIDLHRDEKYELLASVIEIRLRSFLRIIHLGKSSTANKYSPSLTRNANYILDIPWQILVDEDFMDIIEKLIFQSVIEEQFSLFRELLAILMLLLIKINSGEQDIDVKVKNGRIIPVLGGFIFLVSEFRRDYKYIDMYIRVVRRVYNPNLENLLEASINIMRYGDQKLKMELITRDSFRYLNWFQQILSKINELPKTYEDLGIYSSAQEVPIHSSRLVRKICANSYNPIEDSIKGLSNWIKKREMVISLISVLKEKINESV